VCCSVLQCLLIAFFLKLSCGAQLCISIVFLGATCVLQRVAACCSVLPCVAVCCSVLQCAAVPFDCMLSWVSRVALSYAPQSSFWVLIACCIVLECVVGCCSVLQCVAVCCRVLQCVAVCCSVVHSFLGFSRGAQLCFSIVFLCSKCVLQRVAVCCRVLPCVAVCCRVLQCVAVCCSVLQCVAVCCSVLRRPVKHPNRLSGCYVCAAVCCSVCCSALQCVAVCCGAQLCRTPTPKPEILNATLSFTT